MAPYLSESTKHNQRQVWDIGSQLCLPPWVNHTQATLQANLPVFCLSVSSLVLGEEGWIFKVIGEEVEGAVGHVGQLVYGWRHLWCSRGPRSQARAGRWQEGRPAGLRPSGPTRSPCCCAGWRPPSLWGGGGCRTLCGSILPRRTVSGGRAGLAVGPERPGRERNRDLREGAKVRRKKGSWNLTMQGPPFLFLETKEESTSSHPWLTEGDRSSESKETSPRQ